MYNRWKVPNGLRSIQSTLRNISVKLSTIATAFTSTHFNTPSVRSIIAKPSFLFSLLTNYYLRLTTYAFLLRSFMPKSSQSGLNTRCGVRNTGLNEANTGRGKTSTGFTKTNTGLGETNTSLSKTNTGLSQTSISRSEMSTCFIETNTHTH